MIERVFEPMPCFMLDTNICIYLMKHQPASVRQRLSQCYYGDAVISAITAAELAFGLARSDVGQERQRILLRKLEAELPVVPFDDLAAMAYGPLRHRLGKRDSKAPDKLIAAHAISIGATLVTNNTADFEIYDDLKVENWVQ